MRLKMTRSLLNWYDMWQILVSGAVGFLIGNLVNLVELGIIMRVLSEIRSVSACVKEMLKQFKNEGDQEKWLG